MDKFEQFFKDNRLKLDVEPISDAFQKQMSARYKARKKRIQLNLWMSAAAILVLFLAAFIMHYFNQQTPQIVDNISNNTTDIQQSALFNPYQSEIDASIQLISEQSVPSDYLNLFEGFILQLQIIDKQEAIYKNQIEKYGYTEEMIQQLQFNYELKLLVLKKLQNEIKKINHLIKNSHHEYEKITL